MENKNDNLEQLRALSKLLDTKFTGPFGTKFGIDPILGLIPGIGDFITSAMSLYIIAIAASMGVGSATLIRMGINVIFENIIDMVPLFGNLFDFYWKANTMNMAILEKHLKSPTRETIQSRMIVAIVFIILLLVLVAAAYFSFEILYALFKWITTRLD